MLIHRFTFLEQTPWQHTKQKPSATSQESVHHITPKTPPNPNKPSQSNEIVTHILHEMKLHINYCNSFGISEPEIQATEELQGKPPKLSPFKKWLHFLTCHLGY